MIATRMIVATVLAFLSSSVGTRTTEWTGEQLDELKSLSLSELGPLPADPSNRFADDPRAARLGKRLFEDTRLSSNGRVSCATCHRDDRDFQDSAALGEGVGKTARRTMPLAGTAYSPFLFWDGRKDSQWAQALGPLESPVEHGGTRVQYAHVVADRYRDEYETVFGKLPDLTRDRRDAVTAVFVNVGKAIAAYERTIQYQPSRFDRYVDGLTRTGKAPAGTLNAAEVAGLRLFVGKANCTRCHNGPLLTNNEFHNTGVPASPGLPPDAGRRAGASSVLADEFNCRSRWSDAPAGQCAELEFLDRDSPALQGAFKAPSLRNVARRAPYMHAGQFGTLAAVLDHYNRAPVAPVGATELQPLRLTARELAELEAFLRALDSHR